MSRVSSFRRMALSAILAASAVVGQARAETRQFPQFDLEATCRDQAKYAFAATLGQADFDQEKSLCLSHETEMRAPAEAHWERASARSREECVDLASGKYSTLDRCLEPGR